MTRKASRDRVFIDTFSRTTSRLEGWDITLRSASGNKTGSQPSLELGLRSLLYASSSQLPTLHIPQDAFMQIP